MRNRHELRKRRAEHASRSSRGQRSVVCATSAHAERQQGVVGKRWKFASHHNSRSSRRVSSVCARDCRPDQSDSCDHSHRVRRWWSRVFQRSHGCGQRNHHSGLGASEVHRVSSGRAGDAGHRWCGCCLSRVGRSGAIKARRAAGRNGSWRWRRGLHRQRRIEWLLHQAARLVGPACGEAHHGDGSGG